MHLVPVYLYDRWELVEGSISIEEFMSDYRIYRNLEGLYFLIQDDHIVYVGSTVNVRKRMQKHRKSDMVFNRIVALECPDEDMYGAAEILYIAELNPMYNKSLRTGGQSRDWKEYIDWTEDDAGNVCIIQ